MAGVINFKPYSLTLLGLAEGGFIDPGVALSWPAARHVDMHGNKNPKTCTEVSSHNHWEQHAVLGLIKSPCCSCLD